MMLLDTKTVLIIGIIAFVVMSFWSLFSMPMGIDGKMARCPFMDHSSSFCPMTVSEHINAWQKLFTVLKAKDVFVSLFSLLVILAVGLLITKEWNKENHYQRLRNYLYRYKPEIKLFDSLLIAFSRGILNPQIYA